MDDDRELFKTVRERLFTAVLGDILDTQGYRRQFLPPTVRPLHPDMVLVGRAMPVLEADVFESGGDPFGLMFRALDDLRPLEVYVVTGGSQRYALWGELMTTAALARGAAGVVADGYIRDTRQVLQLGFPVFCHGSYAQDQRVRGKVIDFRVPVEIGGVRVEPGDLVMGDIDGVLVIPREVEQDVIRMALEKVSVENRVREALREGVSAEAAFRQFGVM